MTFPTPILADNEVIPIKLIFGVFMFILWGIGKLSMALKSRQQSAQTTLSREVLPLNIVPRIEVIPASPRPVMLPRPPRLITMPPPLPPAPVLKKPKPVPAVPFVPTSVTAVPAREVSPKSPNASPSPAAQLAKLLRPQSLRTQWLLTEVLAKPLALREDRSSLHA